MQKPNLGLKATLNGTTLITHELRGAFVHLVTPVPNPSGVLKRSMTVLIPKDDPIVDLFKQAMKAAAAEGLTKITKWGGKLPADLRNPLRDGDTKSYAGYAGHYFVNVSSNPEQPLAILDQQLKDIKSDAEAYSGAWYRAILVAAPYSQAGNNGISFFLNGVQKVAEGERFAGGPDARKLFTAVIDPSVPAAFAADDKAVDADIEGMFG